MSKKKQQNRFCAIIDHLTIDKPSIRPGIGIPEEMILDIDTDSGLYLGLESDMGKGYFVGKSSECDGNALTIGVNGSGKSYIIAKSALETWSDPLVALDIKGELAAHYAVLRGKGQVQRPYVIFDPGRCHGRYNVYGLLNEDDPHFVQYVREIANAIIPMPLDEKNSYWSNMARDVLSAAIVFYFSQGFSFIETILAVQSSSIQNLCKIITGQGCPIAKMFIGETDSMKLEHKAIIGTELKRHTMVFATDEYIQTALSSDEESETPPFSWEDVVKIEEPVNVFLCLEQDKLEQWSSVIRLMITQLIRTLERRPDKHSHRGHKCHPILILLDEFPLLGKMNAITSALTTLRSKKVTFLLMIQSLPQLDQVYGDDSRRIIVDNCQYKIILNITEPDSQEYFSKLIGTVSTGLRSVSESYDPNMQRTAYGRQIQEAREPLIHPHEFARNTDIWLHTPYGFFSTIKLPVSTTKKHVLDFERILLLHKAEGGNYAIGK